MNGALVKVGRTIDRLFFPAAVRESPDLRVLRVFGYIGFAFLSCWLIGFSALELWRYALTQDFAAAHQAWHQITHGDLNPQDTIDGVPRYWQVHLELYFWLLAPIGVLLRGGMTLLLIQDACGIIACVIAWRWMLQMLYGERPVPHRLTLALLALGLIILDPWVYWSYAFDFHSEPVAVALLVAAGYAFYQQKTRLGIGFSLGVLCCGDVATTYLAGLGLTLIIASRRYFSIGLALMATAVFWLEFSHRIGAGVMSAFNVTYGYLIYGHFLGFDPTAPKLTVRDLLLGMILHPLSAVYALHDKMRDIYANLAPIGFIGIFSPWAFGISLIVLAENQLAYSFTYSQPNFQGIVMYVFGTVGFVWFMVRFARVASVAAVVVASLAVVNTAGWFAVWMPQLAPRWIRTSVEAAQTARLIQQQISPSDEVVASHGLVGRFADRASVYSLWAIRTIPRDADVVQFVVSPYEGINVESVNKSLAVLDALANVYHATLRLQRAGVWWFTVDLNQSSSRFAIPSAANDVPAWACFGKAATPYVSGPPAGWHAVGDMRRGYVVSRAYWRAAAGNYVASADLSSRRNVTFEVWDSTSDELIVRKVVPPSARHRVEVLFRHLDRGADKTYDGLWAFVIDPVEAPLEDNVEIRIFSDGTGPVDVYRVGLRGLSST
jgi:uncharacterized membrane protein